MHFYGIGWNEVQMMPFSEMTRLYKCAEMLQSRARLIDINVANFADLKKDAQQSFVRHLKSTSMQYLERKVKDYREVVKNLATSLMERK